MSLVLLVEDSLVTFMTKTQIII